jgi:uncharacterized protein YtpQ (UPF0354 family)
MSPKFTERAFAYLKAVVFEDSPKPVILSRDDSPVLRPLSDDLCVAYLVNEGGAYHYVQNRHLDQDGISEADLHEIGLRNLAAHASQGNLQVQPYENIYAVFMGGDFEASLILLDDLWDRHFRQCVSGEYAVALPARDILAFCDRTSATGLAELGQLIQRIYPTGDHLLSNQIYVRHQNQWQPNVP